MPAERRGIVATREAAVARALAWFDAGHFLDTLRRRVAYRTESQRADARKELVAYLRDELAPALAAMGFSWRLVDEDAGAAPFLIAGRIEDPARTTVLSYAHGDVVAGQEGKWGAGRSPWHVADEGERWYGRGTADNKGQHSINLAALAQVLEARGRLGFNVKLIVETGEELGSPGLRALCERERDALAAEVFIASDGPRLTAARPTLFLGSRGAFNFDLVVELRAGAHHSGNWGGLIANPATILAGAIASLVDARGRMLIDALRTHFDAHGFRSVAVVPAKSTTMRATRLDPANPWVARVAASIERTTGAAPAILPGIGGSLPNDCFAEVLALPTIWIPHSYPACSQHAPDEHLLAPVARDALAIMTGLWYDLGDNAAA